MSQPATSSRTPKVLLVDDEPLMRLLYKRHIEKAGYQFLTAKSAQEGLLIAQAEKPGVVVLDVMLSGPSGLAALRRLKAHDETKSIPVIIFTSAMSQDATRQEADLSGATLFLTKPISPERLVNEIKRLVPIPAGTNPEPA